MAKEWVVVEIFNVSKTDLIIKIGINIVYHHLPVEVPKVLGEFGVLLLL